MRHFPELQNQANKLVDFVWGVLHEWTIERADEFKNDEGARSCYISDSFYQVIDNPDSYSDIERKIILDQAERELNIWIWEDRQ